MTTAPLVIGRPGHPVTLAYDGKAMVTEIGVTMLGGKAKGFAAGDFLFVLA